MAACLTPPGSASREDGLDDGEDDAGADDEADESLVRCPDDRGPQQPPGEHWSVVSYPGWTQGSKPAEELRAFLLTAAVFTHVVHDSMAPDATGELAFGVGDLAFEAQACAGVVGAHSAGAPILIALGGGGRGAAMARAADDDLRPTFVASIVRFVEEYGYDGVSLAWFEEVEPAHFIALVGDLASAFAQRTPRPLIAMYSHSDTVPLWVVETAAPYLDAVHVMSYWPGDESQLDLHIEAGVPRHILQLGVGLVPTMVDAEPTDVTDKIERVIEEGLLGVESWEVGSIDPLDDPRLAGYEFLEID